MNFISFIKNVLINFCANTNIHGFSYIVQSRRHFIERLFWIICVTISFVLTGILINKLLIENQRNPTIIYTDQNVVHVTDIDFPSVTFMPGLILKTPLYNGFNYEYFKKISSVTEKFSFKKWHPASFHRLQIASLIARDGYVRNKFKISVSTHDIVKLMRKVFPSFWYTHQIHEMFPNVPHYATSLWANKYTINLTEILCQTGFCFTFNFPSKIENFFKIHRLSKDFNFTNFWRIKRERKAIAENYKNDFSLSYGECPLKGPRNRKGLLFTHNQIYMHPNGCLSHIFKNKKKLNNENYYENLKDVVYKMIDNHIKYDIFEHTVPKQDYFGLPFVIHSPYEVISDQLMQFNLLRTYRTTILVTPRITKHDASLAELSIDERQCYLSNEKKLRFFNIYNRVNCEHECLARMTLKSCNCTQFYMVRSKKTRICGLGDEKCFWKIESNFQSVKSKCKCYELCERIEYDVKMDVQKIIPKKVLYIKEHKSFLEVNFAVDRVLAITRSKQQTLVGFFSLTGGFLGLFAGFSVLSKFEFFYFLFFEPILKVLKKNDNRVYTMKEGNTKNKIVWKYLRQFLNDSSIHGFNHIGNDQKFIIERTVWLILFLLAMTGSYFMVIQVYKTLQIDQVLMTTEGLVTKSDEVPFPAITFTDLVILSFYMFSYVAHSSELEDFTNFLAKAPIEKFNRNVSESINTFDYQMYSIICRNRYSEQLRNWNYEFFNSSQLVDELQNEIPIDNWYDWQNSTWNVNQTAFYAETLTMRGIGYSFNMFEEEKLLKFKKLTSDYHYKFPKLLSKKSYPWSTSAGDQKGLEVEFFGYNAINFESSCVQPAFAIHGSNELPYGSKFRNIGYSTSYDILITLEIIKSDEGLQTIPINVRKCVFQGEKKLKYFKIYTQKNCEIECLSRLAYYDCGCVPFYFVRNQTMKICDFKQIWYCAFRYEETNYGNDETCRCFPLCNSVSYSYEINEFHNVNKSEDHMTLTFRYKDNEHLALLRYQPFKLVDFLSYVGSILGLFAGISVLSIVEIFYYFVLRILSNILKFHVD
ncbi:hypothetical protein PVAND_015472 [Polypedilum vanderplanki]|uniref:Uncharacterized protein n=1 Tax=Polypedilum vanderplanki TaxID=319348 RepID=A0A9J6BCC1_POLVA|nr:hypothetical protein PVAND_015472 [Polypedilum vanderplanki]